MFATAVVSTATVIGAGMYRADKIRGKQGEKNWSNEVFAQRAEVNINTVTALRRGDVVSLPTLKKAADALGLTMQELFEPEPETANA
jgi:transcriptional regulator with XRE-family HTH domain